MLMVVLFALVGSTLVQGGTAGYFGFSDACRGCVYKTSGIGYTSDPYDCNKYFICNRNTQQVTRMACPHGLYWNNDALTCDWPYNVDCNNDGVTQITTTAVDLCSIRKPANGRRTYFELVGGSWEKRRCEDWQMYDSDVCECVNDPCYGKRKYRYRPHYYWQQDNGVWKVRPCALGTAYNETSCNCDIHSSSHYYPACRAVLFLPLHRYYGIRDISGNNHHIDNHGVVITQNTGYWDGDSYLSVPYFTNGFYGNKLTISFYFKRLDRKTRVLLSNSICDDVEPSILIYMAPDKFCVKLRNDAGVTVSTCIRCERVNVWQLALLRVEDGRLFVRVPTGTRELDFYGNIATTHCPLTIGKGADYNLFKGNISWLTVYSQCRPYIFRSSPAYLRASQRNPENMESMARLVATLTTTTTTNSTTTTTPLTASTTNQTVPN